MQPSIEAIQDVFFCGMREGWAFGYEPAQKGPEQFYRYVTGSWELIDGYEAGLPDHYSVGQTTIRYCGVPVWVMHYFGYYHPAVIDCVKLALRDCYVRNFFWGGRGPAKFTHLGLTYLNHVSLAALEFQRFSGQEEVLHPHGFQLGFHCYHGGVLFAH